MIKTTLKEIKKASNLNGREEFKRFLKEKNLKPVKVDLLAYSESIYGLGAYLASFTLNNGLVVNVNTGNRASWNYSVGNADFGLDYCTLEELKDDDLILKRLNDYHNY